MEFVGRGVYGGLRLRFLSEVRGYYPDPDGPRRFSRRLQSWQALNALPAPSENAPSTSLVNKTKVLPSCRLGFFIQAHRASLPTCRLPMALNRSLRVQRRPSQSSAFSSCHPHGGSLRADFPLGHLAGDFLARHLARGVSQGLLVASLGLPLFPPPLLFALLRRSPVPVA